MVVVLEDRIIVQRIVVIDRDQHWISTLTLPPHSHSLHISNSRRTYAATSYDYSSHTTPSLHHAHCSLRTAPAGPDSSLSPRPSRSPTLDHPPSSYTTELRLRPEQRAIERALQRQVLQQVSARDVQLPRKHTPLLRPAAASDSAQAERRTHQDDESSESLDTLHPTHTPILPR